MMNKSQILKKIGIIIHELNEQHQYLTNTNKINILELELFTANADFLIDHIEILKKLNNNIKQDNRYEEEQIAPDFSKIEDAIISVLPSIKESSFIETAPEEVKELNVTENDKEEKEYFDFSFDEKPADMVFDFERTIAADEVFDSELSEEEKRVLKEKVAQPEILKIADESKISLEEIHDDEIEEEPYIFIKEEVKPAPLIEIPQEIAIIPESVKQPIINVVPQATIPQPQVAKDEKRPTLNEMLSARLGHSSTHVTTSSKSVSDLKSAISLNDKMVFIKELFNGYNLAYSEAIEIINRFESFEAADNFLLKNYSKKNDWENKAATVERFYEYLNRKFIK